MQARAILKKFALAVSVSTDSISASLGCFHYNESWLLKVYGRRNVGNCVQAFFSPLNERFKGN